MKTETDKRFIAFSESLKEHGIIPTYKAFCESISISPQVYNDIKSGRRSATIEMIISTCNAYNVSADKFLFGDFFSETKTPKNVTLENRNSNGNKIGNKRKLQKTLPNKSVHYDMPEHVSSSVEGGQPPYIKGPAFVEVPVVDIDAAAGGGAVNSDYTDEFDKLRIPTTILPATASTRRCINVAGESMEPTLFDGARIIVRLLHRAEWAKIRSGSVYVVTNRDGETFIKRVRNKLRAHGVLVLTSDNPDQRRFKPFELTEEEIFNVWAVELVITDVLLPSQREETDDLRDQISELREMFERFIQREN